MSRLRRSFLILNRCCCLATAILIWGCNYSAVENKPEPPTAGETDAGEPAAPESSSHASTSAEATTTTQVAAPEENHVADTTATPAESSAESSESAVVTLGDPTLTSGIPGEGDLTIDQIDAWLDDPTNHVVLDVRLPLSLAGAQGMMKGLDENPMTRSKIELGRQLYFDTRLSSDNTISCASCHHPDNGFGKDTQFGIGVDGQEGGRNSPVAFNRIITDIQFWDGRAATLEEQAQGPIANPIEMGNTHEQAVATVQGIDGYVRQFAKVFPDEGVTIDTIAKAIATFERALVTGPAPYDYLEVVKSTESQYDEEEIEEDLKDEEPELYAKYKTAKQVVDAKMSESARRGAELFFSDKSNCTACHTGANFSDELYHNLGVGMEGEKPDLGRFDFTKVENDKGAFKTPTVRNIVMTGPYMHDGSQQTLEEIVEWYAKGGHPNDHLSDKIKKLELTDQEKSDLIAFMREGLTSEFPPVEEGRLP